MLNLLHTTLSLVSYCFSIIPFPFSLCKVKKGGGLPQPLKTIFLNDVMKKVFEMYFRSSQRFVELEYIWVGASVYPVGNICAHER